MEYEIWLHPRFFGPQIKEEVKRQLYKEVEGSCLETYGYVIAITAIDEIKMGFIELGRGSIPFKVKYKAVVFRVFIGEVLDAVVTQVNKVISDIYFFYNIDH